MIQSLRKLFKRKPKQQSERKAVGKRISCERLWEALEVCRGLGNLTEHPILLEPKNPSDEYRGRKFTYTTRQDVRIHFKVIRAMSKDAKVIATRVNP